MMFENLKKMALGESVSHIIKGLDEFTRQYLITALWAENDESDDSGGRPLDDNYSLYDLSEEALKAAIEDCKKFQEENFDLIKVDLSKSGHNFWLSRNGHGAGFFDDEALYGDDEADILQEKSHEYGEVYLYVGDDGEIHMS
jgi:hypothetical protein